MKVTKIKLGLDDVNAFVNAATECDFDIDVNYNRVIIDAKSILGVLGLDLGRVLTVTCHGESQKFDNFLQQYAVAYNWNIILLFVFIPPPFFEDSFRKKLSFFDCSELCRNTDERGSFLWYNG